MEHVKIGRFEIERVIGRGGMGVVYRATDRSTGGLVALKLLLDHRNGLPARFAREGRVLEALSHPGIVRFVANGTTPEGEPYIAMEWLEGEDLGQRLSRGPLPLADALSLIRDAASALGAAHAEGITHRDIKPGNLFLEGSRVRVLDFGIAQVMGGTSTLPGSALGTPGYMAPEQISGGRDVGPPADVFGLGCVLYECLVARPAFAGEHPMALLAKILFEEAPRLRDSGPDPAWLDELVARMLDKSPASRAPDGTAVARALEQEIGATSATRSPATGLRGEETLMGSVVLAIPPSHEDDRTTDVAAVLAGAALAGDVPPGAVRLDGYIVPSTALHQAVSMLGGELVALPNGSLVVVVRSTQGATDRAAQAVRVALALQAALPEAAIAAATGRGPSRGLVASAGARPFGEAIDRAAMMLGKAPPPGTIVIDDVTAGLLDARFIVEPSPEGTRVLAEREIAEHARTLLGKGFHVQGGVGFASYTSSPRSSSLRVTGASALLGGFGGGWHLGGGWEGWVSDQWSLGGLLRLDGASFKDDLRVQASVLSPKILFVLTFN